MINKKSKKADLENKRSTFFLIGLVIALGFVLFAFEWKTPAPKAMEFENRSFAVDDDIFIPPTQPEKKEPPQQLIEAPVFELVNNDALIEDEFIGFVSGVDDENIFDIGDFIFNDTKDKNDIKDEFFVFVEEMPEFPGGEKALLNYLATHINYPAIAQENGIKGKVYVSFVIDENGNINNVTLVRGVDKSLDNEALRVIRSMPKWKPGKQRGKPVKVQFNVPITFELQ